MNSEISALQELKGRLTFLGIEYLDTGIRIRPALMIIEDVLNKALKGPVTMQQVDQLGEEISNLRVYLAWLECEYPHVKNDTSPTIKIIDWLLSGESNETKH